MKGDSVKTPQLPAMAGMTPLGVKPESTADFPTNFDDCTHEQLQFLSQTGSYQQRKIADEILQQRAVEDRQMEMEAFTR